jgi:hypothetical protein
MVNGMVRSSREGSASRVGVAVHQAPESLRVDEMTSVRRENKVKFAALSLSASSPGGDDTPYLEWHQLDHMPEQYQIPGLLYAQRWASTPRLRAARAAQSDRFRATNHVVQYLFGEPLGAAVDDWFVLGARLHEVGRFPYRLPSVMLGGFEVVACHAAERAQVTPEIVPYRPNRGVYLVIERPQVARSTGGPTEAPTEPDWTDEQLEQLLATDGVAGMWTLRTGTVRADRFDQTGFHVAVCYLDGDPGDVANPIGKIVRDRWNSLAVVPELAAPFAAVRAFEWERFGHPG